MRAAALAVAFFLPSAYGQLNTLAKAAGLKYFGTATLLSEFSTDPAYLAVLSNTSEWGQITPGNEQKWDTIEPANGTFAFTQGDAVTALAAKNGQLLRCHNLVWHNQLPSWVSNGTWTNETLVAALQTHITTEVTHYKGQCYAWDVVNEALNDNGTFGSDVFLDIIGSAYIQIAFETAAAADPNSLKAAGVKIDGVGFQSHFIVGETPSTAAQTANMESFTALGVEVAITELDIRMNLPNTTAHITQQAADYKSTVAACLAVADCVGITVWDFDDKYSWVPSTFPGTGDAVLFTDDLVRTPAYYGVVAALTGTNQTAPNATSVAVSGIFLQSNSTYSAPSNVTTTPFLPVSSSPERLAPLHAVGLLVICIALHWRILNW